MNMESIYEYGSRAGFWRLHRMFTERAMPRDRLRRRHGARPEPEAAAAMKEAGWEIASHGLKWIDYQYMDRETERRHMAEAIRIHTAVTGERPLGWYTGRMQPQHAGAWSPRKAASSTAPIPTPTICPTGRGSAAGRS